MALIFTRNNAFPWLGIFVYFFWLGPFDNPMLLDLLQRITGQGEKRIGLLPKPGGKWRLSSTLIADRPSVVASSRSSMADARTAQAAGPAQRPCL